MKENSFEVRIEKLGKKPSGVSEESDEGKIENKDNLDVGVSIVSHVKKMVKNITWKKIGYTRKKDITIRQKMKVGKL